MPHNHKRKLAKFYYANSELLKKAIDTATETQKKWDKVPISDRWVCFVFVNYAIFVLYCAMT